MKQFFVTMEIIAVTWWEAENIPDTKSFIFIQPQESPIPPTAFSSFVTKCSDSGIAEAYRAWKMQFLDPHNEGYGPPLTLSLTLKRLFLILLFTRQLKNHCALARMKLLACFAMRPAWLNGAGAVSTVSMVWLHIWLLTCRHAAE